jgi:hypothetical protein
MRTRSALTCLVLAAGGLVTGVAAAPAASANGPCGFVTTDSAQVHENPSINSVVRKTVPKNYVVTGPNWYQFCNGTWGTDGRYWQQVDCSCATDGVGFIIRNKLVATVPA